MGTPRPPVLAGLVVTDWASTLEVAGTVTLLATVIVLGVAVFIWARNWRQRLAEEATNNEEHIESYQQLLDEGLIDDAEFERIRARLGQATDPPATPPPQPPATGIREGQPPRPTDFRAGPPSTEPPSEET